MCGCTSECFHRCPERMHRIVDAGAARIGLVLGQTGSAREWAGLIDHTLLKPEATDEDIKKLCQEAATYHFASVCVNPTWVRVAACNLLGSGVPVCTVIGFPLGATLPDVKAYEARRAILDGADAEPAIRLVACAVPVVLPRSITISTRRAPYSRKHWRSHAHSEMSTEWPRR